MREQGGFYEDIREELFEVRGRVYEAAGKAEYKAALCWS